MDWLVYSILVAGIVGILLVAQRRMKAKRKRAAEVAEEVSRAEYERNRCTAMSPMGTGRCENRRDWEARRKGRTHQTGQGRIGLLVQW